MNKQELIKAVEELPANCRGLRPMIDKWSTLELIKLLDEPQPVKVPQFVADWIKEARKTCKDVAELFEFDFTNDEVGKWFMQEIPFDLVARAWLDGYEVEEEKRYEVILRNGQSLKTVYRQGGDHLDFEMVYGDLESFTRKRLEEAGFGWVFDCPGIKIEEVE
ncbi:DUF1642 domain-containing protein [Streptococcus mitis]|uniref:DUF1642 domain-containing protein n=1 Tax=Streptococcus mitis TaxID=28037 RepID=UPI0021B81E1D|nr:DUF1642 domain-containing protein [Streptococcus mitis]